MINAQKFGVSFSLKQCRSFGLDGLDTLDWLIARGFRRFRIMSYWNEHEKQSGNYDWAPLDWQFQRIAAAGGVVSLCLGARQPRWPENHWPDWAWQANCAQRTAALLHFVEQVVNRYKNQSALVSYQLENEALLENFGQRPEVSRPRLNAEYQLVRRLDPKHTVIMTTSTAWGIPIRRPIPQAVGFSFYHTLYQDKRYRTSLMYPWVHRLRKQAILALHNQPVFVHELQLEPWGPQAIWEMSQAEQAKSMDAAAISRNIRLAQRIRAYPIDLWGGEWWYWRLKHGDPSIWRAVAAAVQS